MRVIAGRYGGRRIQAPPGHTTRPTSDRVREALFSILGDRVVDARVLDLFAGSGALGIEALSRGAASATFVDTARSALRALRDNLEALGADGEIIVADAREFLRLTPAGARQYDLVFLDPPYRAALRMSGELSESLPSVLAASAIVVTESDRRAPLDLSLPLTDERRYGDTLIRLYEL